MTAGAHFQTKVGLTDPELCEEDLRHRLVVVLSGVHEKVLKLVGSSSECGGDGRNLHEVRSCTDHGEHPAATVTDRNASHGA